VILAVNEFNNQFICNDKHNYKLSTLSYVEIIVYFVVYWITPGNNVRKKVLHLAQLLREDIMK